MFGQKGSMSKTVRLTDMSYQISLRYVAKWRYPDIPKSGGKKRIRIIIIRITIGLFTEKWKDLIKDQGFSGTLDRSFHYYNSVTNTVIKYFNIVLLVMCMIRISIILVTDLEFILRLIQSIYSSLNNTFVRTVSRNLVSRLLTL